METKHQMVIAAAFLAAATFSVTQIDIIQDADNQTITKQSSNELGLKIITVGNRFVVDNSRIEVLDENNTVVEGAEVTIENEEIGYTDSNGSLNHSWTQSGNLTVSASLNGSTVYDEVRVAEDPSYTSSTDSLEIRVDGEDTGSEIIFEVVKQDNNLVENVSVAVDGTEIGSTDRNGSINHVFQEPGNYTVTANHQDHETSTQYNINSDSEEVNSINLNARETANPGETIQGTGPDSTNTSLPKASWNLPTGSQMIQQNNELQVFAPRNTKIYIDGKMIGTVENRFSNFTVENQPGVYSLTGEYLNKSKTRNLRVLKPVESIQPVILDQNRFQDNQIQIGVEDQDGDLLPYVGVTVWKQEPEFNTTDTQTEISESLANFTTAPESLSQNIEFETETEKVYLELFYGNDIMIDSRLGDD